MLRSYKGLSHKGQGHEYLWQCEYPFTRMLTLKINEIDLGKNISYDFDDNDGDNNDNDDDDNKFQNNEFIKDMTLSQQLFS